MPAALRLTPVLFLLAAGCAASTPATPPSQAKSGPHGGPAVALPDGQGFVEVVVEAEPGSRKGAEPVVAAYFYREDLKTPLPSPPESATVKLSEPGGGAAEFTLGKKPSPRDPAGPARLASARPATPVDPLMGELTAPLGGSSVTVPFPAR